MTDQPTDDGADDAPIKPEVVRGRGASARKRRVGGEPVPVPHEPAGDEPPPRTGRSMFRIGCLVLGALGVMLSIQGALQASDPEATQCLNARAALTSDADDTLEGDAFDERRDEIKDLSCAEAFSQSAELDDYTLPSDGAIRTLGGITIAIGAVQIVAGLMTARTRSRRWRTVGLAATLPILALAFLTANLLLLLIAGFVVFALVFSSDAKSIFGGGTGFLRPRIPPRPAQ